MKIICDKNNLIDNINIVSKAVSTKTTMTILECIHLRANDEGFKMTANDMEMCIETSSIPAEIEMNGSVALDAKIFAEIIRKMPDGNITIFVDNNFVTLIQNEKVEFKILGKDADEFPLLPAYEKNMSINVPSYIFKDMIKQTIFSISVDPSKQTFMGELLEIQNGWINLVSVDGFRISFSRTQVSEQAEENSVIIPGKTLNELVKILPSEGDEELYIHFTRTQVVFELSSFVFVSRLLDGEFLKYQQSFSDDYNTMVTVNKQELILSLERAMLISKDTKKNPVYLAINENIMVVHSQTEMGTSVDEIPIECDGQSLEIAFNPKFLVDVLKVINEHEVNLMFTTNLSPCIIKNSENDNYKYLILPLRTKY